MHRPVHPVRFVTAASLFDGHDAAINIMRRILQVQGAEAIHLGHNRSVREVVDAAVQEDVQGVAISAYQGGHVEYFTYLVELLAERGVGHIKVFGGGGGVIVPREIELLQSRGVVRIFSPADGQHLGLAGMINSLIQTCDVDLAAQPPADSWEALATGDQRALARTITAGRKRRGYDQRYGGGMITDATIRGAGRLVRLSQASGAELSARLREPEALWAVARAGGRKLAGLARYFER